MSKKNPLCNCHCICNQRFIGKILRSYCDGKFGRDGYGDKTIEFVGEDYIVIRYTGEDDMYEGQPQLVSFKDSNDLEQQVCKWLQEDDKHGNP